MTCGFLQPMPCPSFSGNRMLRPKQAARCGKRMVGCFIGDAIPQQFWDAFTKYLPELLSYVHTYLILGTSKRPFRGNSALTLTSQCLVLDRQMYGYRDSNKEYPGAHWVLCTEKYGYSVETKANWRARHAAASAQEVHIRNRFEHQLAPVPAGRQALAARRAASFSQPMRFAPQGARSLGPP